MTTSLKILIVLIGWFCHLNLYAQDDSLSNNRTKNDSLKTIVIPDNLEECFIQLDIMFNDSIKKEVQSWNEDELIGNTHFSTGLWIRNNWGLWRGSNLSTYFNELGIFHPDDMSCIILISYQRKLLHKPIELEEQVKYYKRYWKKNKN